MKLPDETTRHLLRAKRFVVSADFVVAAIILFVGGYLLPLNLDNGFLKDIYSTGITVLSIIFSVYFAALAVIISASDDDFVRFLSRLGYFSELIFNFKLTLAGLFGALAYSIVMYGATSYVISLKLGVEQSKWFALLFVSLFAYGIVATLLAMHDAIRYAEFRSKYLALQAKRSQANEAVRSISDIAKHNLEDSAKEVNTQIPKGKNSRRKGRR